MSKIALGLRGKSDKFYKIADNAVAALLEDTANTDVYISTYHHDRINDLWNKYQPVQRAVVPDTSDGSWYQGFYMVCVHTITLLEMIQKSGVHYHWIIITRLDATFEHGLRQFFPLDPSKIHVLCKCEREPLIDDNLWIFTPDKIDAIIKSLRHILSLRLMTHDLKHVYETTITSTKDAFAFLFPGEYFLAHNRPFMKFARELPDA